jgi:hypothetical protein
VMQWEGGADRPVHGHATRRLPDLDLNGWKLVGGADLASGAIVEIVATLYADDWRSVKQLIRPIVRQPAEGARGTAQQVPSAEQPSGPAKPPAAG